VTRLPSGDGVPLDVSFIGSRSPSHGECRFDFLVRGLKGGEQLVSPTLKR
jgi:hypothetical protein